MFDTNKALHQLAKRKHPHYVFNSPMQWIDVVYDGYGPKSWHHMCLICDAKLSNNDRHEHGMQHLKDHNLLALI